MARALGVELSPGRCALVELTRRGGRIRLKQFVSIDAGSDEPERLAGELRRVRRERRLPNRARAVVWTAASLVPTLDGDYHDRLEALRLAGFSLEATASPPEALSTLDVALERDTRAAAAYLAVNPDGAALAVVRGGELLIGHEFDWNTLEDPSRPDRRALGRRLGAAVQRVLLDVGAAGGEIDRISLCGSLPRLRALTQPLGEALGRPVEVLDTIEGIDTAGLDVPILELQKDLAGLRLAWAMAEGALSRAPRSGARTWIRPVAAAGFLAAAVAATLFACWPRDPTPTVARQTITSPAPVAPASVPVVQAPPPGPVATAPVPDVQAPPPGPVAPAPVPVVQAPPPGPVATAPVPVVQTPPREPVAPIDLPARAPEADSQAPELVPPRPASPRPAPPRPAPRAARPAPPSARAGPPGWKLRSILVSDDRRLAIIDGRIVGPGDRVGRDVVLDIEAREVRFTDEAGREGRVQLWEAKPGVTVR